MEFFKKSFVLFVLMNVGLVNVYGLSSLNGPLKNRYSLDDPDAYVHARVIKEKYGAAATQELITEAKVAQLTAAQLVGIKQMNVDLQMQKNRQETFKVAFACLAGVLVGGLCVIGANAKYVENWIKVWRGS